jgi:MFS family permease
MLMPRRPDPVEVGKAGYGSPNEHGVPTPVGAIPLKAFLLIGMSTMVFLGVAVLLLNVGNYIVDELKIGTSAEAGLANALFTILGVAAGFSFPLIVKFTKRLTAPIGYTICAAGLACLVFANTSIFGIFVGACLCGFGLNFAMPYVLGQVMAITPPRWIPVAISINMGGMNMAMTFNPNIMGGASRMLDGTIESQFLIGSALVAVGVLCATVLCVLWKNPAPPTAGRAGEEVG